jgi:hypothetical protein
MVESVPTTAGAGRPRTETTESRAVDALIAAGKGAVRLPLSGDGKAQRRRLTDHGKRIGTPVDVRQDASFIYASIRPATSK